MEEDPDCVELYRRMEMRNKAYPPLTLAEKLAIAEKLRAAQEILAPIRAANRAKRARGEVKIRIKIFPNG